jgi:hypothetical protein
MVPLDNYLELPSDTSFDLILVDYKSLAIGINVAGGHRQFPRLQDMEGNVPSYFASSRHGGAGHRLAPVLPARYRKTAPGAR